MTVSSFIQIEFLIPISRDSELSDGRRHPVTAWRWLDDRLWDAFGGATKAPGYFRGFYRDPDTGERVHDQSRKYIVALTQENLDDLRHLLTEACWVFQQKCIYLNIAGHVEFIQLPDAPNHEADPADLS